VDAVIKTKLVEIPAFFQKINQKIFRFHKYFIFGFYNSLTNMEVTNESNPKSLGLCQQKTTEKFYFISDFICPFSRNFSLFDSDEVQQNSRKQSLQITQYFIFYQKDRKWTDLQVVGPSIREQD